MTSSLQEAIERKHRSQTPASILVFDIDNFKSVNDNYGHGIGDHVLKEFAAHVNKRIRRLDRLFRIGGEEFMLFLPDTSVNGAVTVAEEIRVLISKAEFIKGKSVTVSIGVSELQAGENMDDWIKSGDDALYSAKENGKNQVSTRMHSLITDNLITGNDDLIEATVSY